MLRQSLKNLPSGANAFSFKTFVISYDNRISETKGDTAEYWFTGLTLLFLSKDGYVKQMISAKKGQLNFSIAHNDLCEQSGLVEKLGRYRLGHPVPAA